jgi:hypothetical protein
MAAPGWSALESKSPEDASSQIGSALVVGDAALILRCREQNAVADSTKDTYLGDRLKLPYPVFRSVELMR